MSSVPPHCVSLKARSLSSFLNLRCLLLGCNAWLGKCLPESMTQVSYLIIILFISPTSCLRPTLTDCRVSAPGDRQTGWEALEATENWKFSSVLGKQQRPCSGKLCPSQLTQHFQEAAFACMSVCLLLCELKTIIGHQSPT